MQRDPHLLAAILTVASQDFLDDLTIHEHCANHMQKLVAELVAGEDCGVEAVEA